MFNSTFLQALNLQHTLNEFLLGIYNNDVDSIQYWQYGMLPESYITYEIYKACYRNYQTSQDVAHDICYMHTLWGSSCLKLQLSCITLLNQNAGTGDLKRHLLLF